MISPPIHSIPLEHEAQFIIEAHVCVCIFYIRSIPNMIHPLFIVLLRRQSLKQLDYTVPFLGGPAEIFSGVVCVDVEEVVTVEERYGYEMGGEWLR
jgi:hypothetical protein